MVTFNLYFVGDQYFQFEYTDGLMDSLPVVGVAWLGVARDLGGFVLAQPVIMEALSEFDKVLKKVCHERISPRFLRLIHVAYMIRRG